MGETAIADPSDSELPDLGEATLPDLGAPELPELPDLPDLPDLSGDSELPDLPDLSSLDGDASAEPGNDFDRAIEELQGLSPATAGMNPAAGAGTAGGQDNSSMIWGIPVEVQIVIGTADLSVAHLMELESGKVVELDRRIGEPVDVMVNGKKIASGEITLMEDDETRFGIKIIEMYGN